jgi:hypothetical protein
MHDIASQRFLSQINDIWPKRNYEHDRISLEKASFHEELDNKKTTAKKLVFALVDLEKNGLNNERISAIVYNNKKASCEKINKFWVWEEDDSHEDALIHIYFNPKKIYDSSDFDLNIFRKPKKEKKQNQFPGIRYLQYKRKNRHVKIMQQKLKDAGFFISDKEFGYYGKETCKAVSEYYRLFMSMNSGTIVKDGKKFGPKGWKRLFE